MFAPILPPGVDRIRRAFEESRPADVSSSALETALTWLKRHGPVFDRDGDNLADLIKDELDFRSS